MDLATALSAAAAAMWVRSYHLWEGYAWADRAAPGYLEVSARDGRFWLYRNAGPPAPADTATGAFHYRSYAGGRDGRADDVTLGFAVGRPVPGRWWVSVLAWFACAATAALPAR
jgi:hypothetical protein